MSTHDEQVTTGKAMHSWLRKIHVAFVPGPMNSLLDEVSQNLLHHFRLLGHHVQEIPDDRTDVLFTTAPFEEPIGWREALIFNMRRRFNLSHTPALYTLVSAPPARFRAVLDHFQVALAKEPPDPADFAFPGLTSNAYHVLFEQGHRGGPILALERLVQAQAKGLRIILVVGNEHPLEAYHFDLVGAYPRSVVDGSGAFYEDIALRIVTTMSATEVTAHEAVGEPIPYAVWRGLSTPTAMQVAGRKLGERNFFTEMVRISDLVSVPAVPETISNQYSEGCFATWEPALNALIATVTGSARPVDKGSITEDDLAVLVGVRPDLCGALTRLVEGKRNDRPSSEAVEMMDMDSLLPTITLNGKVWNTPAQAPVVRSKLHGHRGIAAYDPQCVEYIPLDPPYYHYLVSCGTDAQARGIKAAFARAEALRNPDDARQVAFTVLPGHGAFIAEKWVAGKAPFQVIWEIMDAGALQVDNRIPQGAMAYVPGPDGRMVLRSDV
jgi:hypothetical protein